MVSLLKEVTLTDVEKADFAGMIAQMAWHNEEHSAKVLAGLAGDSKTTDPARRRRNLQDFTAFLSHGHNHFWTTMQSNTPMTSKLQFLRQHLLKLGLRTPSEHTLKLVCSFWVFQVHSPKVLATLTTQQKAAYLKHVKGAFDGLRRQCGDPAVWIDRLPCEPTMSLHEYPSIFSAIFARGSPPVISPVDLAGVIALDQSYGCRGGWEGWTAETHCRKSASAAPVVRQGRASWCRSARRGQAHWKELPAKCSGTCSKWRHHSRGRSRFS